MSSVHKVNPMLRHGRNNFNQSKMIKFIYYNILYQKQSVKSIVLQIFLIGNIDNKLINFYC